MTMQSDAPILDLHKRFSEAELAGDVAALGMLLDDDFVGVGPLGFSDQFEFTPEFIAALENG